MRGKSVLLAAVFALVLYPVIHMDMPQAWAKGPAAKSGTTSRVSTPSLNTGASSSGDVQAKKKNKSSGDKLPYLKYEMKDVLISN